MDLLAPFLRAHALAREETSPTVRILHSWVALEYLALGVVGSISTFLSGHLSAMVAMAGVRTELFWSWREVRFLARRSPAADKWLVVEKWLGVDRTFLGSPNKFIRLICRLSNPDPNVPNDLDGNSTDGQAAAFLLAAMPRLGPFVQRRLENLGRTFSNGSRLAKAAEANQNRAVIAFGRLQLARHLAVHQGLVASEASACLATSGIHLLDSVFEILQRWMQPTYKPFQAMGDARQWYEQNVTTWKSPRPLVVDGEHLIHPTKT